MVYAVRLWRHQDLAQEYQVGLDIRLVKARIEVTHLGDNGQRNSSLFERKHGPCGYHRYHQNVAGVAAVFTEIGEFALGMMDRMKPPGSLPLVADDVGEEGKKVTNQHDK